MKQFLPQSETFSCSREKDLYRLKMEEILIMLLYKPSGNRKEFQKYLDQEP